MTGVRWQWSFGRMIQCTDFLGQYLATSASCKLCVATALLGLDDCRDHLPGAHRPGHGCYGHRVQRPRWPSCQETQQPLEFCGHALYSYLAPGRRLTMIKRLLCADGWLKSGCRQRRIAPLSVRCLRIVYIGLSPRTKRSAWYVAVAGGHISIY